MITHLEPDILECEVKWALGSLTTNKANGGDGIPVELFHILKDDAVPNMPANLENSAVATGLERSVYIPVPKKGNAKECSNYCKIALISHTSKVMLKNSPSEASTVCELKTSNCQHLLDHQKKQESSRKTSTSALLTTLKPLTVCTTTYCEKFFKREKYQTTLTAS